MIRLTRVGPLTTLQDAGRFGQLASGIAASGPMDRGAFAGAGGLLGTAGTTSIEFTAAGLALECLEPVRLAWAGGAFTCRVNGKPRPWPGKARLAVGDRLEISPGPAGNYGYLRFEREIDVPPVLGSRATNLTVGLGGFEGRALASGDTIRFAGPGEAVAPPKTRAAEAPIRFTWGLHADLFPPDLRAAFVTNPFRISPRLDRMGARLEDPANVFGTSRQLSLVSDAIVPGDIQILGDGTPIVLLRDHQPTGGYPRIATIVSADLDRFVQLRPGAELRFAPLTIAHAQELLA